MYEPQINPYAPPATQTQSYRQGVQGSVPNEVVELLRRTRSWVTLVGVMGFVFAALLLVVTIVVATGALPGLPPAVGLVYFVMAAVCVAPSWSLTRYAGSIQKLVNDGSLASLLEALDRQRAYWTMIGIFAIVAIAFWVLALIGVVIGAAAR